MKFTSSGICGLVPTVPTLVALVLRRTIGPYKVGDCLGPRARSVPGAEFQHADTAVDVIERRLVEIDWRAARGCAGRRLDHFTAEAVVDPELHGDCCPVAKSIRGRRGRGRGRGGARGGRGELQRDRVGPRHIDAIAGLETREDGRIDGVDYEPCVGGPFRTGEGHRTGGWIQRRKGHRRHMLDSAGRARKRAGRRRRRRLDDAVDSRFVCRLRPHADFVVIRHRHHVSDLDLIEPGRGRWDVKGHRLAVRALNGHGAGRVVDGL